MVISSIVPYSPRVLVMLSSALLPKAGTGDFSILDTLGWALYKLARYDEAETALRDSVDAADTADNHLHLAWVFYKTGRLGLAGRYLRTAAELRPGPDAQAQIDDLTEKLRRSPGRQAPR
ncbi:MAG: hypothetical protein IIB89_01555 [Chloroflexi bacterium]|nr:hypothetical protein [Chloroflexota bacterium]